MFFFGQLMTKCRNYGQHHLVSDFGLGRANSEEAELNNDVDKLLGSQGGLGNTEVLMYMYCMSGPWHSRSMASTSSQVQPIERFECGMP
jgi:hypothetical protein